MKEYIEKIIEVEMNMSNELGKFNLFALFERDDIKDKWDVIISMPISVNRKNEIIKKIHTEFLKELPKEVIIKISRFVFFEPSNPIVQNLNMMAHIEHGSFEVRDSMINNLMIKHALVITSQR
ncbi:hypothetical protein [Labilibaculum sp.]|uniref:hypothetical protein n=1 Tax=Labilibaculum sp. TaxID=2060723 RepID=UPI002AA7D7AB|nr:hypothetical protein [Labilibaculum sp.]